MKERVKWRAVKNRKQQRSMNGEKEGIRGGSKEHGKPKRKRQNQRQEGRVIKQGNGKSGTRGRNQTGEWRIRARMRMRNQREVTASQWWRRSSQPKSPRCGRACKQMVAIRGRLPPIPQQSSPGRRTLAAPRPDCEDVQGRRSGSRRRAGNEVRKRIQ